MQRPNSTLILYPAVAKQLRGLGRRDQVLEAIWDGKCTKAIASELGLSPKTVEYHRARLYRQFEVNNSITLCRRALARGILRIGEGRER